MNKKLIVGIASASILIPTMFVSAANYNTRMLDKTSSIINKTTEEVQALKNSGKTYGQIAKEAGKLEEFKVAKLENLKAKIKELVDAGKLTEAEGNEKIKLVEDRMNSCTGDGTNQGTKTKLNLGLGQGSKRGNNR